MKSRVYAMVAASVLSIPLAAFAQTSDNGAVTRAQVRQDLIQVEQAGYNPANANDPYYPNDIQAAEARVHQQEATAAAGQTSGYGGVAAGSAEAGAPMQMRPANSSQSLFSGH